MARGRWALQGGGGGTPLIIEYNVLVADRNAHLSRAAASQGQAQMSGTNIKSSGADCPMQACTSYNFEEDHAVLYLLDFAGWRPPWSSGRL